MVKKKNMLTYTKQPRSLPAVDEPVKINTDTLAVQPVKTGDSNKDEINNDLISIYYGLNELYVKLQKINSRLIQYEKEKNNEN